MHHFVWWCLLSSHHPAITRHFGWSIVKHLRKCKKPIRNLIMSIYGQEISVLQKKSNWGNQDSPVPHPNYRNQVYCKHDKKSAYLRKLTVTSLLGLECRFWYNHLVVKGGFWQETLKKTVGKMRAGLSIAKTTELLGFLKISIFKSEKGMEQFWKYLLCRRKSFVELVVYFRL